DSTGAGLFARGSFTIDGRGELLDCRDLATAGPGLRGFMASITLHYGEWGGEWGGAWIDLL
ncbi:MAG: hypothetical protein KC431_03920, partial [Myxococcales bacterium]|nr:hypothetical protein [Myxococcales bacterium]